MNRTGLIAGAASFLREKGHRKKLPPAKRMFYISDDEGNSKQMVVSFGGRELVYTVRDVGVILDSLLHTIYEAMKRGEPVQIVGFGTIRVKFVKGRTLKSVNDGKQTVISDRYIPKIVFGRTANLCAKLYELSLKDIPTEIPLYPDDAYDFDEYDDEDEEALEVEIEEEELLDDTEEFDVEEEGDDKADDTGEAVT